MAAWEGSWGEPTLGGLSRGPGGPAVCMWPRVAVRAGGTRCWEMAGVGRAQLLGEVREVPSLDRAVTAPRVTSQVSRA